MLRDNCNLKAHRYRQTRQLFRKIKLPTYSRVRDLHQTRYCFDTPLSRQPGPASARYLSPRYSAVQHGAQRETLYRHTGPRMRLLMWNWRECEFEMFSAELLYYKGEASSGPRRLLPLGRTFFMRASMGVRCEGSRWKGEYCCFALRILLTML